MRGDPEYAAAKGSNKFQKLPDQPVLPLLPGGQPHHHPRCHGTQPRIYHSRNILAITDVGLAGPNHKDDIGQTSFHGNCDLHGPGADLRIPPDIRGVLHFEHPKQQLLDVQEDALKPYPWFRDQQGKNHQG